MKSAYNPAFVYMGIYPRETETGPQKNLYTNIHSRFICNNQKLEMTQKSIKGEELNCGPSIQFTTQQ